MPLRTLLLPVLALLLGITSLSASGSAQELPRRQVVGLALEPAEGGTRVIQAPAYMPAGQAGIREGDVIRSANGVQLRSTQELGDWLRRERPEAIDFLIERDGRQQVITMRPAEPPRRESADFDILYGAVETVL